MSAAFPFTQPEGSDAGVFIQWKGTDLCMDLHCTCGENSHFDTDFAYFIKCPGCGQVYEMGTQVILKKATPERYANGVEPKEAVR